jgi:hypothetical protein
LPLNLTKTDSGISIGIAPIAAAKATSPEPAGNEIPMGKRVWDHHLCLQCLEVKDG